MESKAAAPAVSAKRRARRRPFKRLWTLVREPLAASPRVKGALAGTVAGAIRFVDRTNRRVPGSHDLRDVVAEHAPAIAALWHGQHLMAPIFNPPEHAAVALFSRSADAELNALVAQRFGFEVVRGSGGRGPVQRVDKGGARALIALRRAIEAGKSVAMIADIPHGTPRVAGLGVVTLARITGRPIVPMAIATSRRKVLHRSWDKTTLNLPFGRSALVLGAPIFVPADADDAQMEAKRLELTEALNRATADAYRMVDRGR
ncbi:lysophospholipid acyltransferase family protein [Aquibium sp. A9E412]|uniref:lysophospholipid acyltransferase family protein n=1 Tax=Aquibium sp. A9E412 TaxID=2976767 RepID=UPI0025AF6E87|nr:lysophospholipid acyltransferase family protein [Aquibium sp. A9E412]MDN2566245.1 lysophospholipid acyltransferase family protein [Aquibium sp. A9E412]